MRVRQPPALAHAGISPDNGVNGATVKLAISIPHGCEGAPTDTVIIRLPEIGRIDRQVSHLPRLVGLLAGQTLADRILMAARKRSEHQLASIRVTRVSLDRGAALDGVDNLGHGRQIERRIYPLAVEVHRHGHQIHIAGTLTVTQQSAFHPIGTGHHRQFGGGHATAAIIVGVH